MSIFGNRGERSGKARASEQVFRGEVSAAEQSAYTRKLETDQKAEQGTKLRADIQELDENIQAITASIKSLEAKIQEGNRIAGERGSEKLSALNVRLEEAAQQEKSHLLGEKETLEMERQKLAMKLGNL